MSYINIQYMFGYVNLECVLKRWRSRGKLWTFFKKTVLLAAFGKCLNLTSAWLLRKCENHMNLCALWKVMKSKSMNRCSLLTSKTPFFFSIRSWLMDKNLPCFFHILFCSSLNVRQTINYLHRSYYIPVPIWNLTERQKQIWVLWKPHWVQRLHTDCQL